MSEKNREIAPWRRALEVKRELVRAYMESLDDDTLVKICYLFMRGFDDKRVMKELDLTEFALNQCKERIAEGLRLIGVQVRE